LSTTTTTKIIIIKKDEKNPNEQEVGIFAPLDWAMLKSEYSEL